jgi:hypothetical protein
MVESAVPVAGFRRFHLWVVTHDESRLFLFLYISLALVLSIVIGLFWLVVLVGVHLAFEHTRCRNDGAAGFAAWREAIWGVRLDVALVLFALALAVYLEVVFGVLGLHAMSRAGVAVQAGVRGGVRFATWEKVIRGILLSIDDAVQGARAVVAFRTPSAGDLSGSESPGPAGASLGSSAADPSVPVVDSREETPAAPSKGAKWSLGDLFAVGLGATSVALILAAPWLTPGDWAYVLEKLATELRPFPGS